MFMKSKRIISFLLMILTVMMFVAGCSSSDDKNVQNKEDQATVNDTSDTNGSSDKDAKSESVPADNKENVSESAVNAEPSGAETEAVPEAVITGELTIKAEEPDAVKEEGNKYILTKGGEYHIRGTCGNRMIYIDAKDQELDIHLEGVSMTSEIGALIFVENAEEVAISATDGTNNELSDNRPARTNKKEDSEFGNAAIYSKDDLKLKGRGRLTVNGSYNNGIGCKNDIKIKNLTLTVNALNNGIKGNDSVTVESGNITINAQKGNGIKTENTHISDKGKQKGYVTITGGNIDINSADDPIDAAYDLILDSNNATVTTNK